MSTNNVLLCSPYVLGLSVLSNGHQVSERTCGQFDSVDGSNRRKDGNGQDALDLVAIVIELEQL